MPSALPSFEDERRSRAELRQALDTALADTVRARAERDDALAEVRNCVVVTAAAKEEILTLQDDLRRAQETHAGDVARLVSRLRRHETTIAGLAVQIGVATRAGNVLVDESERRTAVERERQFHRLEVTAAGEDALAAETAIAAAGDAA